jgi:hypothetical protein
MPGAGRNPWPACKQKTQAAVTTGSAISSGIPCAMVLRLIRALPRDRAFLPLSLARSFCELGLSVGRPGPHDFAVRKCHVRRRGIRVHRVPASRVVTIAIRPLASRRDARIILLISGIRKAEYFLSRGWTAFLKTCPSGKSAPCVDVSDRRDRHKIRIRGAGRVSPRAAAPCADPLALLSGHGGRKQLRERFLEGSGEAVVQRQSPLGGLSGCTISLNGGSASHRSA